jgi:hypothetical protein
MIYVLRSAKSELASSPKQTNIALFFYVSKFLHQLMIDVSRRIVRPESLDGFDDVAPALFSVCLNV